MIVRHDSGSEFSDAVYGKDMIKVLSVVDELMVTVVSLMMQEL